MPLRPAFAGLMLLSAAPLAAQPARFEQKVVAIMNAGGTADTVQGRLSRIGTEPGLTVDQRLAIDALSTLVRSRGRPNGLSLAEAEAFANRHPGTAASAMLVAEAALAADDIERSADTLIAAAGQAGSLVELISPATVSKLSDALDRRSDTRRTAELGKALLYSGWGRGSASLRSFLALAAIRDEIAAERIDLARSLLPVVRSPVSLHVILIDDRLKLLRDEVVERAGQQLELAWRDMLTTARNEWLERGDVQSAVAYAEALKQAGQYEALTTAFMARFMRGYNCTSDLVARSISADLVDGLARIGRWTRAGDVIRRSGGISPALYAAMLLERGEFGQAKSLFERSLRSAPFPKDEDQEKAIAWLRAGRDCAAAADGEQVEPTQHDLDRIELQDRLLVLLCVNQTAEAKSILIEALADEEDRADALRWVQPFTDPPAPSKFRLAMNARIRALQRDAGVQAAANRYGVILDWALTSSVPPIDELPPAKGPPGWQCGSETQWDAIPARPESVYLPDSSP